ncbi:MAG: GNAT family N-acetyltransferase [Flavobacteriaceae bacterium]|nr:GNAT family N-acetyltransferase [Flavobacteriaceae bacterium]
MKTIETERTILRPFTLNDAPAVLEFNSNPEVIKYTGDILFTSLEQTIAMMNSVTFKDYETHGYGRYAVVYKADNKVIGFCGLKYLPEHDETDIGYRFLPEYWGKGIASETAEAIVEFGLIELGLKRIIGVAEPNNIASCKVLEKIGLTYYKTDRYAEGEDDTYWYKIER